MDFECQQAVCTTALEYGRTSSHIFGWNYIPDRLLADIADPGTTRSWRRTDRVVKDIDMDLGRVALLRNGSNWLHRFEPNDQAENVTPEAGVARGLPWFEADREVDGIAADDIHTERARKMGRVATNGRMFTANRGKGDDAGANRTTAGAAMMRGICLLVAACSAFQDGPGASDIDAAVRQALDAVNNNPVNTLLGIPLPTSAEVASVRLDGDCTKTGNSAFECAVILVTRSTQPNGTSSTLRAELLFAKDADGHWQTSDVDRALALEAATSVIDEVKRVPSGDIASNLA